MLSSNPIENASRRAYGADVRRSKLPALRAGARNGYDKALIALLGRTSEPSEFVYGLDILGINREYFGVFIAEQSCADLEETEAASVAAANRC
jgi:hypothetical protein